MISVIIPTYNRKSMLVEAVRSVQAQTFRDWELVVVDDGSTDGSFERVGQIQDPRIRALRQSRSGVSRARNRGIEASRFDWLAFLDSDDRWRPRKLERQLEGLEAHPEYRMCHTDEIWIRRGVRVNPKRIHRKYGGWIFHRCLPLCSISPSSFLVHRSLLDECGKFDPNFPVCEDYECWLRLTRNHPILFLPEPLVVKFGGHADQLSRSRWGLDRYRISALIKAHESGGLTFQQRQWTAREIAAKAKIVSQGFEKRGKLSAGSYYRQLAERWSGAAQCNAKYQIS